MRIRLPLGVSRRVVSLCGVSSPSCVLPQGSSMRPLGVTHALLHCAAGSWGGRSYPNKINSFFNKSGKVAFPWKSRIWWKFTYQNSLFSENLNGPYGPYQQLLWDVSPNKWPKHLVFDENSLFWKMTMSKISGNGLFGQKKPLRGAPAAKQRL